MNSKDYPLVTLAIPAFNHEKYVEQAILSLVNQSYKNTEIIVIDDGSVDNTSLIVEKLSRKYNFTFIRQENIGLPSTLNHIIRIANGEFIAFCASDDFFTLDKVETQVLFLQQNKNFAVCGGEAYTFIDGEKRIDLREDQVSSFTVLGFEDVFLYDKSIPAGTAMIRKGVLEEIGCYSKEYPIDDKYIWLKITYRGYKIARINRVFQYYRIHNTNTSGNIEFMLANIKNCLDLYKAHNLYEVAVNNFHAQTFNKYIIISRMYSAIAFNKINWRKINTFMIKELVLGIFKVIKFKLLSLKFIF